jgi:deoxyribose-phosphate aldolase
MRKINSYIDHTLLKPTATEEDIKILCEEALNNKFYAVCIHGCYVKIAKRFLNNSEVKVCTVIGFPLGAMASEAKEFEAKQAIFDGADEVDMVINIGWAKSGKFDAVKEEIASVKKSIGNKTLKVILEICYLTLDEIKLATQAAIDAKADFVKTSTGFGTGGATLEAVEEMKKIAQDKIKIKASGGIRDYITTQSYLDLGVTRIGTSSGISILEGKKSVL